MGDHPDPEIRGTRSPKKIFFGPSGLSLVEKQREWPGLPVPCPVSATGVAGSRYDQPAAEAQNYFEGMKKTRKINFSPEFN